MSVLRSLHARPIVDSRGEWTLEVRAESAQGIVAWASVPQGKSVGSYEAASVEVKQAIENVHEIIAPALIGTDVTRQAEIDSRMREIDGTENKSKLGANAMLGVSLAAARLAAHENHLHLWQYIRALYGDAKQAPPPRLFVNMINGGLHAGNGLQFQEYMVIPKQENIWDAAQKCALLYGALRAQIKKELGNSSINVGDEGGFAPAVSDDQEPFRMFDEVLRSLKLRDAFDFGLDAAANSITARDGLGALYRQMRQTCGLWYLEDPFGEEEFSLFAELQRELGDSLLVTGDDLTVTNVKRMQAAHENKSCRGVIIKPNQIGTLTETLEAVRAARTWGWFVVVSHRSGETNDDFIADLAWAAGADGIKLGAPARGERTAKYNRLMEIESQVKQ